MIQKTYARVHNGQVVECPVTEELIRNRGHSLSMYLPAKITVPPAHDRNTQYAKPRYEIKESEVWVHYDIVDYSPEEVAARLEAAKQERKQKIREALENEMATGKFTSSLGFVTDARRAGTKHDKDNLKSLIELGSFPIQWKDVDGVMHSLDETAANTLLQEMIQYGLSLYQKKWNLEEQIDAATTFDELNAISW